MTPLTLRDSMLYTVVVGNSQRENSMTTEERVARLEGQIEHMATKADIARVEARIDQVAAALTWRMIIVAGVVQALGIGALIQFLPRP